MLHHVADDVIDYGLLRSPGVVELVLWTLWALIGVPILLRRARSPRSRCTRLTRWVSRVSRRKQLSIVLVGLFAFFASAAFVAIKGPPVPHVHDEFSYLLAGDTFAHGRLSNPTPPAWEFFETFHVLLQPRYASMLQPAQGVFLAIGQALTGRPYVGVWLSMASALAALTWMLQAWTPPRWALSAALLATAQLTFLGAAIPGTEPGYWSHSYWGGAVAMGGGALVFGALRRILSGAGAGCAVTLGAGLVILAFSRPLEGLLVALPAAGVLVRSLVPTRKHSRQLAGRVVLPILSCLTIGAAAFAWYNRAVTGDAFLLPHVAYERQYFIAPNFLWTGIHSQPTYRHPVLAKYFMDLLQRYGQQHGWRLLLVTYVARVIGLASFFGAGLFFVPLLAAGAALRDRWTRFAAGTTAMIAFVSLQVTYQTMPHYLAPAACLIAVVLLRMVRCLRLWHPNARPVGRALICGLPLICVAFVFLSLAVSEIPAWSIHRREIERNLENDGHRHLVVIRYGDHHNPHEEWVYNRADLDAAAIVWARDMGWAADRRLLERFGTRTAWLLDADSEPPRIVPFPNHDPEQQSSP